MAREPKKWIQRAVSRPGALTRKAERAGMSPMEYARTHKHSPGRTGRQARLALTFKKMARGKKRGGRR